MQSEYNPTPRSKRAKAPFDALFSAIVRRKDISPQAKLVYAKLTTMNRLGAAWTQAEIGYHVGLSRHQVWASLQELIAVDLVEPIRYGLGRSNGYKLYGVDEADLTGTANTYAARLKRIREARYTRLVEIYGEMCLRCGSMEDLQIDHVISRAAGGPDQFDNLQLLCKTCNYDKGKAYADYRPSPGSSLVKEPDPA